MSADRITTYLGVSMAILHQAGVVGTVPMNKTEWMNTGVSVALGFLGYFTNKAFVAR